MSFWPTRKYAAQHPETLRHEALFGGRGEVRVRDLLGEPSPLAPFGAALACELDAGGAVGIHVQSDLAEVVIFVEGRALVTVGAARREAGPGAVVPLPLGETLAIENASQDEPLRYLIVKAWPPSGA